MCYECHELMLHNPVVLPGHIEMFAELVRLRGLTEDRKTDDRNRLIGRIKLFQEVIARGIEQLVDGERAKSGTADKP
jgi:hypothetical protein